MLPGGRLRARLYNRNNKADYIQWLVDKTGVRMDEKMLQLSSRHEIDAFVESLLQYEEEEAPSWAQAAIDSTGVHWTGTPEDNEGLGIVVEP